MRDGRHWSRHTLLSALIGFVGGALTIALIEWLGHEAMRTASAPDPARASPSTLGTVLLAWVAGAFVGAGVASRWSGGSQRAGWAAAAMLCCATAATLWMIPHPTWVSAAAVVLMPAAGWLGATRTKPNSA